MKKRVSLTVVFALLFVMMSIQTVMASQSESKLTYTSAEGFDPADGIYVKAESKYYWKGRYSNGRVFSEYIANELAGGYENLTNYAVGGAFTGVLTGRKGEEDERSNWSPWLKGWGGVEQTERFLAEMDGKADPKALYIIEVGGNDAYAVEDLGVVRAAELSSDFAFKMVQNLVEGGAKYIFIPNRFKDDRTDLKSFSDMMNQQAVHKIEEYLALDTTPDDVVVVYGNKKGLRDNIDEQGFEKFGYKSMGFYLISDWAPAYGYALASEDNSEILPTSEEEEIYGGYGIYSTDSKYYNPEAAGLEPDDFYTYDEYHLSSRTHKHKATYLLNSDIATDDGKDEGSFKKVYNGEVSNFSKAITDGTIPSEYSWVYTFGASGIDSGRALEVTTELVKNRDKESKEPYKDDQAISSWAKSSVYEARRLGFMIGDDKNMFSPKNDLTRGQFAKMIVEALDLKIVTDENGFSDVDDNKWYASYINTAVAHGIVQGYGNGKFGPNDPITREQIALMIGRTQNWTTDENINVYKDQDKISKEALPTVLALYEKEIMIGDDKKYFNPKSSATREMAAVIMIRLVETR